MSSRRPAAARARAVTAPPLTFTRSPVTRRTALECQQRPGYRPGYEVLTSARGGEVVGGELVAGHDVERSGAPLAITHLDRGAQYAVADKAVKRDEWLGGGLTRASSEHGEGLRAVAKGA